MRTGKKVWEGIDEMSSPQVKVMDIMVKLTQAYTDAHVIENMSKVDAEISKGRKVKLLK